MRRERKAAGAHADAIKLAVRRCESPIEALLATALLPRVSKTTRFASQVPIGPYRVDFLLELRGRKLVVEADGAAFHTLPADAARDRVRDAYLRQHGYEVVRLTGAQISKSPVQAAGVALEALRAMGRRAEQRTSTKDGGTSVSRTRRLAARTG